MRIAATRQRGGRFSHPCSGVDASRWLLRLGIVVALACVIGGLVLIVIGPKRSSAGVARIVVPGAREIVLSDPGRYTLYYEHRSIVDGQRYNTQSWLPPVEITIQDAASGSLLMIEPSTADSYEYTRYAGVPILRFEVSRPGRIIVDVVNRSDRPQPFVMAVSNRPIRNPQRDFVPGIVSIALGLLIASRILLSRLGR